MHLLSSSSSSSSSLLLLPILTTLIALRSASAERTEFPASPATCANSNADLPYVIVQPLCDSAIAVICNVTVDRYTNSSSLDRYRAVGEVAIGACEAQIIFPEPRPTFTWDVNTCVKAFQEITINCMLLRRRWSAKEPGQQAGISGLAFDDQLGFSALDATGPGYLVGPPTYYGDIGAVNLTDLVPGNAKPAICHYTNNGTTKQCDMQPYSGPPISAAEIFYAQSDSASRSKATSSAGGASPSATVAG